MSVLDVPVSANASVESIQATFSLQSKHHWAVARSTTSERIAKLQKLHACLLRRRREVEAAIWKDFRKSPTETDISEMGVVLGEIRHTIKHLRSWMSPKRVGTPLATFGSSSWIHFEPKGVCLIISPWNYPFNLTLGPLVSAVAAGNCCIIKPSEFTPNSSALMRDIVAECFAPEEVSLFEGDASVSQALLDLPFNHIFFTGSPAVGKVVMAAAAKNLASVTLELGGKSPVVIDETANVKNAAAKVAWLKCMNAGQICIEPDYVLVHESRYDEYLRETKAAIEKYYGKTSAERQQSPDLCRIVNVRHLRRVKNLVDDAVLKGARVSFGGVFDESDCFADPTILENLPADARINEEEIFGPVLPIYKFKNREEATARINAGPRPLAMYIFSEKTSNARWYIQETRSGGVAVNDCGIHFYNNELPFGGVNNSGIGKTHGEFGFLEFSNQRGVSKQTGFLPSTDFMLPPYGGKFARMLLEGVVKWF